MGIGQFIRYNMSYEYAIPKDIWKFEKIEYFQGIYYDIIISAPSYLSKYNNLCI